MEACLTRPVTQATQWNQDLSILFLHSNLVDLFSSTYLLYQRLVRFKKRKSISDTIFNWYIKFSSEFIYVRCNCYCRMHSYWRDTTHVDIFLYLERLSPFTSSYHLPHKYFQIFSRYHLSKSEPAYHVVIIVSVSGCVFVLLDLVSTVVKQLRRELLV